MIKYYLKNVTLFFRCVKFSNVLSANQNRVGECTKPTEENIRLTGADEHKLAL